MATCIQRHPKTPHSKAKSHVETTIRVTPTPVFCCITLRVQEHLLYKRLSFADLKRHFLYWCPRIVGLDDWVTSPALGKTPSRPRSVHSSDRATPGGRRASAPSGPRRACQYSVVDGAGARASSDGLDRRFLFGTGGDGRCGEVSL